MPAARTKPTTAAISSRPARSPRNASQTPPAAARRSAVGISSVPSTEPMAIVRAVASAISATVAMTPRARPKRASARQRSRAVTSALMSRTRASAGTRIAQRRRLSAAASVSLANGRSRRSTSVASAWSGSLGRDVGREAADGGEHDRAGVGEVEHERVAAVEEHMVACCAAVRTSERNGPVVTTVSTALSSSGRAEIRSGEPRSITPTTTWRATTSRTAGSSSAATARSAKASRSPISTFRYSATIAPTVASAASSDRTTETRSRPDQRMAGPCGAAANATTPGAAYAAPASHGGRALQRGRERCTSSSVVSQEHIQRTSPVASSQV